jgi:DNA-binding beta-propeller fold protein YncE
MSKRLITLLTTMATLAVGVLIGSRIMPVQGQGMSTFSAAAFPNEKGGQDIFGGYDVAPNWPKPISGLPGNEKWTWGAGQGLFAESANRVFLLQRGQLPNIPRPQARRLTDMGPSLTFPIGRLPWRDATSASLPAAGGAGGLAETGVTGFNGVIGVDTLWANCFVVIDANGNILETWSQWDNIFKRPHAVYMNPTDPQKRVYVVDDHQHAIYIFSNDGKQLLQTIGTPSVWGADGTHFNRPTYMDFFPNGSFVVADGYNGNRVAKFDKDGKFLMDWGQRSSATQRGPGYFSNVHGIAVDTQTNRVFVNDRGNKRVQVFDENGKYLDEWSFGGGQVDVHSFIITADRALWAADRGTSKMLKYDLNGKFIYSWGTWGDFPGAFWGVHGIASDPDGNFYTAAVDSGGGQKFIPRAGARPEVLVGKPVARVWK